MSTDAPLYHERRSASARPVVGLALTSGGTLLLLLRSDLRLPHLSTELSVEALAEARPPTTAWFRYSSASHEAHYLPVSHWARSKTALKTSIAARPRPPAVKEGRSPEACRRLISLIRLMRLDVGCIGGNSAVLREAQEYAV